MQISGKNKSFLAVSISAFIVRILGAISVFFFHLVVARTLDISDAGTFFLSFSVLTVLWGISSLGMPMAIVRFVGSYHSHENWKRIDALMYLASRRIFIASVILAGLVFILVDVFIDFLSLDVNFSSTLKVMVFVIPVIALYNLIADAFQGIHKSIISIFLKNILTPLMTCFVLIVMLFGAYPVNIITISFVFSLCAVITLMLAIYLWLNQPVFKMSFKYIKNTDFIKSSHPLFVVNLLGLLVQWSGVLIVGAFVSEEDAALFTVAQKIAMLTSFVLIAVNLVVAPRFAASFASGNLKELKETAHFCSRLMLISATPVLVIMLLIPSFFLGLFGEEYKQAANLLQILVVGQFVNVATGSVGYLLNMTGHEKDMRNVVLFSGPLAISMGLILTPIYGATGAAVATSLAVSSQNLLALIKVKKLLGFNTMKIF